ncbi:MULTISPECIES: TolC family protein [unclassified Sphingobacterium]|uniref:TolC family protein n=1 Tax=unclassified Sphingobacterium TaxID=2609468 RepID=UPI0020C3D3C3|nr:MULTISPECIES: TolC family protein [unclassified Sphingobacterium]MBV2226959.1 TolC family protein [Sphingobacterium mizutaii]
MKRNYLYVIIFVCCLVSTAKGQSSSLSLADCIQQAIQNNPTLKRNELVIDRADLQYKQAKYDRLPSLNANIGHDISQGRSIDPTTNQYIDQNNSSGRQSLSLNVPIFNGFYIIHNIRMRSNALDAGKLEYEGFVNELKLDVIEAYVKVLTAQDMLIQTEGQLAVTKEQLNRNEILNREGATNPGDLFDIKGQYSSDLNTVELTKQTLNNARVELAGLMNVDVNTLGTLEEIDIPTEIQAKSSEELFQQSLNILPQYKALDWRIKEMEEGIKVAKSNYWPSLSLSGGMSSNYSKEGGAIFNQIKNNLSKGVGLTLSIPIFNQFKNRTQVRLAQVSLDDANFSRDIMRNDLRMKTAQAVFDLNITQKNVLNLRDQEVSYAESFRIATVHFEAGNSNSVIYLTAKNKLDATRSQLIIRQYEWLMQKYVNDYYAGSLNL